MGGLVPRGPAVVFVVPRFQCLHAGAEVADLLVVRADDLDTQQPDGNGQN
jgi:hypothetical protein